MRPPVLRATQNQSQKFIAEAQAFLTERGSQGTASMFRDIQRTAHTEHQQILGDMLARSRSTGVAAPLLRIANAHLQAYEFERLQHPVVDSKRTR